MKQIQEQRMKEYFIESARKMIRGEGLRSISIRSVAENAGYSYATLYTYFKNVKDLISCTAIEFIAELDEFMKSQKLPEDNGLEHLKKASKAYMNYFIQYTGIFDLFFLEKSPEISNNQELTLKIHNYLNNLLSQDWEVIAKENGVDENTLKNLKELHHCLIHSQLLFFISKKFPIKYQDFMAQYERLLNQLLMCSKK